MPRSTDKICTSCQAPFSGHHQACWCTDFPTILPVDNTKQCLCKKCLTVLMQKEISKYLKNLTFDKIKKVQALGKPIKCIEGIDYNLNTQGAWVFSSWYLLRQGHCCGNGCKNCPYDITK